MAADEDRGGEHQHLFILLSPLRGILLRSGLSACCDLDYCSCHNLTPGFHARVSANSRYAELCREARPATLIEFAAGVLNRLAVCLRPGPEPMQWHDQRLSAFDQRIVLVGYIVRVN